MIELYDYFRSSAAYRVRIALNLKGLEYRSLPVNLRDGQQREPGYREEVQAQGLVPALDIDGLRLTQSLAICEYLEETHPEPALLPSDAADRARVRALAQMVACDIHPINNLRILQYLTGTLGVDEDAKLAWYRHWVEEGFCAIEQRLAKDNDTGRFCHGDTPGMADICLVPQVYNANRFKVDMAPFPTIARINQACLESPAFDRARPENQPDAV